MRAPIGDFGSSRAHVEGQLYQINVTPTEESFLYMIYLLTWVVT